MTFFENTLLPFLWRFGGIMSILEEAFELKEYMVNQRNHFHSHPELGLQEFNTCLHIEEELNKLGIKNHRVAGTNVIAEIDSNRQDSNNLGRKHQGRTLFYEQT